MDIIEALVTEELAGERADRGLATLLGISRAMMQRLMTEGRVRSDGRVIEGKSKLRAGQRCVVDPLPPEPSTATPEDLPIDIRYEDEHLLVLLKPAGLVVHPAPGHFTGTLVNALLFHRKFRDDTFYDVSDERSAMRPGIVHRLDKDTSGVMVVAKTAKARDALVLMFKAHDLDRRYQAIVLGGLPAKGNADSTEGFLTWNTWHARHPTDRKKFSSRGNTGKRAITHARSLAVPTVWPSGERTELIECKLETGRTHQIRVHLSEAGSPILGDALYGRAPKDASLAERVATMGRQALHAGVLAFSHPIAGGEVRVEAEIPDDMKRVLKG